MKEKTSNMYKLRPLEQWFCDFCQEIIKSPRDCWLQWAVKPGKDLEKSLVSEDFRIVHQQCKNHGSNISSVPILWLKGFYEESSALHILRNLNHRPYKPSELVEIIRRLEVPYYEQARLYWDQIIKHEAFDSLHEHEIYDPVFLKMLIKEHKLV